MTTSASCVFSDAGGTGRSYHADLGARNQRLRVHYLLEAGWKADTAIQGLGRSNRTNQAQPPLFRPIATDVKAEKRFLSTIARRLDTLGRHHQGPAPDRRPGPVPAGRQSRDLTMRAAALRQLYLLLFAGKVEGCSLEVFETCHRPASDRPGRQPARGAAADHDVPQSTAGPHHRLAEHAVRRLRAPAGGAEASQGAIASGTYDAGVETLTGREPRP